MIDCWSELDNHIKIAAWAIDYVRAMRERSWIVRHVLRVLMGRWAYSEFAHLVECLHQNGYELRGGYCLENMDYHRDIVPLDFFDVARTV